MRNTLGAWDYGGLLDEDGYVQKPLPSPLVRVPWRIHLDVQNGLEVLVYSWFPPSLESEYSLVPDGAWEPHNGYRGKRRCVDEFLRLGDASGTDVLSFAQRWGVLGICKHDLPATHNPPSTGLEREEASRTGCMWLVSDSGNWYEPVKTWRRFARQARELVDMAARIYSRRLRGEAVQGEEWNRLMGQAMWWLAIGDVRPHIFWDSCRGRPSITLGSANMPRITVPEEGWGTLFGLLATQLAFIASNANGFDECDACHELRPVEKRPRVKGRRWYCSSCRADEDKRRVLARERKRQQRMRDAQKGDGNA